MAEETAPAPAPEAVPAPETAPKTEAAPETAAKTEAAPTAAAGKAQQFTDSERERINELRGKLPDAVKAAREAADKPVGTSMWGVELLPEGAADLRADVILNKFLRARNNDVDLALAMLVKSLVWRGEFGVDGLLTETFPEDVFGKVGFLEGRDKEGRPVTYNFYGGVDTQTVFGDLDRFLRWRVQLQERGMRQLDFVDVADMVQVHDYEGAGLRSYDSYARAASKAAVHIMSDNYPETLATKYFVGVPGWGETIFNVIGRLLSEDTKRKFVVASKAHAPGILIQRIDATQLPEKFRPEVPVLADGDGAAAGAAPVAAAAESAADKAAEKAADEAAKDPAPTKTDDAQKPPEPEPAHAPAADPPKATDAAKED